MNHTFLFLAYLFFSFPIHAPPSLVLNHLWLLGFQLAFGKGRHDSRQSPRSKEDSKP